MTDSTEFDIGEIIHDAWSAATSSIEGKPNKEHNLSGLIADVDRRNTKKIPTRLDNWLAIYDEVGGWFVDLEILLICRIFERDRSRSNREIALISLLGNVGAQIVAIRRLVMCGLDLQAKQIVRILIEHLDLAVLVSLDEEVAQEFTETLDGQSANAFWHKRIAKGKLRRALHAKLPFMSDDTFQAELEGFVKQEEQILGMGVHPSLAASQMALLPNICDPDSVDVFAFLGSITNFSERTLSFAAYSMMLYIAAGYVPSKISVVDDHALSELISDLEKRVFEGRRAIFLIMQAVVENWNIQSYTQPRVKST